MQNTHIKKIIDNCDYYVLIIANRYGSINPNTGKSYTEQEYEYALEKNIPVLVFLKNETDSDNCDNIEALDKFKEKVSQNRLCKFWNNQSDLVPSVIISLMEEMSDNPQPGWVRGGMFDNTELLEQINEMRIRNEKLMIENELLKKEVIELQSTNKELSQGDDLFEIVGTKTIYSGPPGANRKAHSHAVSRQLSWNQIFALIGPFLFTYISYIKFEQELSSAIKKHFNYDFSGIDEHCIQTIKIQLNALSLIDISPQKSTGGGVLEFIRLTSKGKKYLSEIVTVKK